MTGLLKCLRKGHLPRTHRTPVGPVCLRCWPCLTCGSTRPACVGQCATQLTHHTSETPR